MRKLERKRDEIGGFLQYTKGGRERKREIGIYPMEDYGIDKDGCLITYVTVEVAVGQGNP